MAFSSKIRKSIRNLHNGECFFCGYNKFPQILEAAHIVPEFENPDACKAEHGLLLCPNCHEMYDRKLLKSEDFKEFNKRKFDKLSPDMQRYHLTGEWPSNTKGEYVNKD